MTFKDGAFYPFGFGDGDMSEGEYAEVYDSPDWDFAIDGSPTFVEVPLGYWCTRDGRTLKIAEMTDAHLDNAIRYFRDTDHPKIDELRSERKRRS